MVHAHTYSYTHTHTRTLAHTHTHSNAHYPVYFNIAIRDERSAIFAYSMIYSLLHNQLHIFNNLTTN